MTEHKNGVGGHPSNEGDLIEIDLNFESMRRFQAEFSPNLSKDGLFIDTGEPLDPGSVVRFRVILPEDFVFLEGTAIVEWCRGAEMVTDGAPGMALRFATLSQQNQELVEQLVQDFVDAGGRPFDLDVRPVLGDFPTDALEGAPANSDKASESEGYRLTVRQTGAALQEDALQALLAAAPDGGDAEPDAVIDEETHDFEILSGPRSTEDKVAAEPEEVLVEPAEAPPVEPVEATHEPLVESVEAVGEPPELDWPEEAVATEGSDGTVSELSVDQVEPDGVVGQFDWGGDQAGIERETEAVEAADSEPVVLDTPREFDDGPEVLDAVMGESMGNPTFEVSFPEPDDGEPDTTPVLPDDGNADVTVSDDDGGGQPPSTRRLWPWVLAAVFVLAVIGGFLRPRVVSWLEARSSDEVQVASTPVVAEPVEDASPSQVEGPNEVNDSQAPTDADPVEGSADESPEAATEPSPDEADASDETTAPGVPETAPEPTPAPEPEPVRLGPARSIESIEVVSGPRGTVVRIRADGSLEDGVLSVEALASPSRLLIRLRGIETGYRPFLIEPNTAEVTTVRVGHHAERRPPELWVVVDLVGDGPGVEGIDIKGNAAELVVAVR